MNYYLLSILIIIIIGSVIMYFSLSTIAEDRQFLELASCDQLMELMNNTDYGIEYQNKWIVKECWK